MRSSSLLIRSLFVSLAFTVLPSVFAQSIERISVDSAGLEAIGNSGSQSISASGRHIAFSSDASNLVPGDTNNNFDIFVHDRQIGSTTIVSVDSLGMEGNSISDAPSISADGRFVAFESSASNLVQGDANGTSDIFVHDRVTGSTTRVSLSTSGTEANGKSAYPKISADGRFVAYQSNATNLVQGDTNLSLDTFLSDRLLGITIRLSVDSAGTQGDDNSNPDSISQDGRYVAFTSHATNLVSGDLNGQRDAFIHDCLTGTTTLANVDSNGIHGNHWSGLPSITSDGRQVAFVSLSNNLVPGDTNTIEDIFVHDFQSGQTTRVNAGLAGLEANDTSYSPTISGDGRYISFDSLATNLTANDTNGCEDIFVNDRLTGQTARMSVNSAGIQGDYNSNYPTLSQNGPYVAFQSSSTNLVVGDTNGSLDVFVRDLIPSALSLSVTGACPGLMSLTISGATANGNIAFVYGSAGTFVKTTPPCIGLNLGISLPTLGAILAANAAGAAVLNFRAPQIVCGYTVQAVDVTTCVATNTIVL